MDGPYVAGSYRLGDQTTSDIIVHLRNEDGRQEQFYCHSSVLITKSKFFADKLSRFQTDNYIEVPCSASHYDNYVKLLNLLHSSEDDVTDSLDSVKSALGLLQASLFLNCESITICCIQYLEAMPWEEKEEEEILKIVPTLGSKATPLVARFQPPDSNATKSVFISAIRFATTIDRGLPAFTDELRISAQEQVEYMLAEDEDTPLIAVDEEVKAEAKAGLSELFTALKTELSSLTLDAEQKVLQGISDLEWICNVLPKMELMSDFLSGWSHISDEVLAVVQDGKFGSGLWGVKVRIVELVGKALDAIGYGSVVLPAAFRLQFLKTWMPYLRTMKTIFDSKCAENDAFPYKMDSDLCQNIEGAIVSLVLTLPSNDQAEILAEWMNKPEELRFPDLSEAFEVWCYRTKAAKRRLAVGLNGVENNPAVSLNEIPN